MLRRCCVQVHSTSKKLLYQLDHLVQVCNQPQGIDHATRKHVRPFMHARIRLSVFICLRVCLCVIFDVYRGSIYAARSLPPRLCLVRLVLFVARAPSPPTAPAAPRRHTYVPLKPMHTRGFIARLPQRPSSCSTVCWFWARSATVD